MILSICAPSPGKIAVSAKIEQQSWKNATWKGSRHVQLRAALAMTVRERLQALEELSDLAQRLANMPRYSRSLRTNKKRPTPR